MAGIEHACGEKKNGFCAEQEEEEEEEELALCPAMSRCDP
jgi:hypothetical protein